MEKRKKQEWRETSLKGRMAESLVYDLLKESGNEIYRIGFEAILPGVTRIEESFKRNSEVGEKIRSIPDFFVIDKSGNPYLIEVKFRWHPSGHEDDFKRIERIRSAWQECFIFYVNCSEKPYFRVMYENKFPEEDDIDARGWTQLLSEEDVEKAMIEINGEIKHIGEKRIGNDVARGGANQTVWAMRSMNFGEILAKSRQDNLTEIAAQTLFFAKEKNVAYESVFIDDIGVGGGAVDPLHYEQKNVRGVNVAMTAMEQSRFVNIRAESYWRLRE